MLLSNLSETTDPNLPVLFVKKKIFDLLLTMKSEVVFKNIYIYFFATTGTTFCPSYTTAIHLLRFKFTHSYSDLLTEDISYTK